VNRTLSSVGGTVAAATAAWEEYSRRQEYLQRVNAHQQTQIRPRFLKEKTKHLCWAGISHPFILTQFFFSSINSSVPTLEHWTQFCFTAHLAGGTHHAFRDYGEGFCIFSGRVNRVNKMAILRMQSLWDWCMLVDGTNIVFSFNLFDRHSRCC
jgi:hypothetical protein